MLQQLQNKIIIKQWLLFRICLDIKPNVEFTKETSSE